MSKKVLQTPDDLLGKLIHTERGCWEWPGEMPKKGYGRTTLGGRKGRTVRIHIIAYEHLVGPVPAGHILHHECENPRCANPAHLKPVTGSEHGLIHHRGRCKSGRHEMVPGNIYTNGAGGRLCRACLLEKRKRQYRERNRR